MLSEEPFPRLLGAVAALHWTVTFGLFAAAAHCWRPEGEGAAISRLADPFLTGPLANREAAFAVASLFLLLSLAFVWLLATALAAGPSAAREFHDVSQLAYSSGIAGLSLAGGFAAVAGSPQALLISTALIATLFASALAVGAGRSVRQSRSQRYGRVLARSMALGAAEQSLRPRLARIDPRKET